MEVKMGRKIIDVPNKLLKDRERNTCIALSNDDISDLEVEYPIDFLYSASAKTEKPVTIFAGEDDIRSFVSSKDLLRARKYFSKELVSLTPVMPAVTKTRLKCPGCSKQHDNHFPTYLLPPCPNGCELHPTRWVVMKKGVIDRACGMVKLENSRGKHIIHFYIDGHNLDVNNNYAKLQEAYGTMTEMIIDALPIIEFNDIDNFTFALWITRVSLKSDIRKVKEEKEVVFTVPSTVVSEMQVVNSVFFTNLKFMQFYLGFDAYHLQAGFPDMTIKLLDGTKRTIEFEYESRNFEKHKHDPEMTDYIICWIHNRKVDDDVKVIELRKLVGKKLKITS